MTGVGSNVGSNKTSLLSNNDLRRFLVLSSLRSSNGTSAYQAGSASPEINRPQEIVEYPRHLKRVEDNIDAVVEEKKVGMTKATENAAARVLLELSQIVSREISDDTIHKIKSQNIILDQTPRSYLSVNGTLSSATPATTAIDNKEGQLRLCRFREGVAVPMTVSADHLPNISSPSSPSSPATHIHGGGTRNNTKIVTGKRHRTVSVASDDIIVRNNKGMSSEELSPLLLPISSSSSSSTLLSRGNNHGKQLPVFTAFPRRISNIEEETNKERNHQHLLQLGSLTQRAQNQHQGTTHKKASTAASVVTPIRRTHRPVVSLLDHNNLKEVGTSMKDIGTAGSASSASPIRKKLAFPMELPPLLMNAIRQEQHRQQQQQQHQVLVDLTTKAMNGGNNKNTSTTAASTLTDLVRPSNLSLRRPSVDEAAASLLTSNNHQRFSPHLKKNDVVAKGRSSDDETERKKKQMQKQQTEQIQQRKKPAVRGGRSGKKFSWKAYPELEDFLIENRDEYLSYSARNYTIEQRDYNNRLTSRLLEKAEEHGYTNLFKNSAFSSVRDRIRSYYKSYVQSFKRKKERQRSQEQQRQEQQQRQQQQQKEQQQQQRRCQSQQTSASNSSIKRKRIELEECKLEVEELRRCLRQQQQEKERQKERLNIQKHQRRREELVADLIRHAQRQQQQQQQQQLQLEQQRQRRRQLSATIASIAGLTN